MFFTEIGIGNDTFINTEIEFPTGEEVRHPGFYPMRLTSLYVRVWIGQTVWILSTSNGLERKTKPRKAIKILLGLAGKAEIPKDKS